MITFKQAKDELSSSTGAYSSSDIGKSINKALRALVKLHPLRCFREVVRFTSVGPGFVLPQGSAGLVRACVNGSPVTMRGQDFKFMLSGPGDMDRPPFRSVDNILAVGPKPVIVEPKHPFKLLAYVEGTPVGQGTPIVRGYSPDGTFITETATPIYEHGATGVTFTPGTKIFSEITEVVLGSPSTGVTAKYLTLCAHDYNTGEQSAIALYNPAEIVPSFMHYQIPGIAYDQVIEILAEVRMGHIDLVADTDVLPIDTTEPIEYMIRADWEMKSGETQRAETYRQKAEEWLRREEATTSTVQTKITINSEYAGSPGEVSAEAFNI